MRFGRNMMLAAAIAGLGFSASSKAATIAHYPLGEGQLNGATANNPVDSTGNHDFINNDPTGTFTVDTTTSAPVGGSTASILFNPCCGGGAGFYSTANVDSSYPLTDNFEIDIWAKASGTSEADTELLAADGAGTLDLGVTGNHYSAGIGGTAFSTGPAISTSWTELTLVRVGGNTSFYVNNVLQTGTSTTDPGNVVGATMHLGVTPGGLSGFSGNLDELTVSTVPEPASLGLLGLGGLGLLARRRRAV